MKFTLKPKSVPMKIMLLAFCYLLIGCGVLSYMMNMHLDAGCSWRRVVFYAAGIALCVFMSWSFLCGEKIACSFMLGVSLYGALYCMAMLLSSGSFLFSAAELVLLALGVLTFFSGKYFVGEGIKQANTVDSMFIVLGAGICMFSFIGFLLTGSSALEAVAAAVCGILFCLHTKAGKFSAAIYMFMAVIVYGALFYLTKNVFYLFIAICDVGVLVITYIKRDYLNIRLNSKLHK